MSERLRPADCRFLVICLLLLAGTVWFSARYFYHAFPEASIQFRVNRQESRVLAERFLAARGIPTGTYRHASRFSYDGHAKTFLEREVGLARANALLAGRVRLWRWSHRWFRPQHKEEYRVDITPQGEMAGFERQIEEAAPLPSLGMEQARAAAEDFLRSLGRDPAGLEFVEGSSLQRPKRTDFVFTWKEGGFEVREATYRFEVRVLGNTVGGYKEYLKVPEKWSRDYQTLRSRNEVTQTFDTALMLLLVVGMLAAIVVRVRRRQVRWRRAAVVGIIGAVLVFLSNWNSFPLAEFRYPTTDSYGSFVLQQLLNYVLSGLAAGGLLFLLTAGAEPLYRESYGGQVSLANLFRPKGIRTRSFLRGTVLGIALAGIFVAYQTGFYLVAYRFGAWSPADVPYDDLLNTRFPWLFVLVGGFLPAVSEEWLFRMFAIPYLKKLFRATWVALVLAGFLWGFGHSSYPQQPFWIRGVEVGVGGVALGWIMLRWGILPTLVWHYSVDAVYSALLLMRSPSLYYQVSGAVSAGIMVLPVVVALVLYWRRGGFEPEEGLTNAGETLPAPAEAAPAAAVAEPPKTWVPYAGLGRRRAVVMIAVFCGGMLIQQIPIPRFGEKPMFAVGEAQAVAAADAFLSERGLAPATFRHVAFPDADFSGDEPMAAKYFLERKPLAWVSDMFERHHPVRAWGIRYFRPLDREEMEVSIHPETGRVLEFNHTLPEDRPGAWLTVDDARERAIAFASAWGWDFSRLELKEASSEDKKARRDHRFQWEARPGDGRNLDQTHYRLRVDVSGGRVTALRAYWKTPETFQRARSERNFLTMTLFTLRIAGGSVLVVAWVWLLIAGTRRGTLDWPWVIRVAVFLTGAALLSLLLGYRSLYRGYNTAMPWGTFQATLAVGMVMGAIGLFLFIACAVALLAHLRPEAASELSGSARARTAPGALLGVFGVLGLAALFNQAAALAVAAFPASALPSAGPGPGMLASPVPALSVFCAAFQEAVVLLAAVVLAMHLLERLWSRPWLAVLVMLPALAALVPQGVRTGGELAVQLALRAIEVALAAGFLWFLRGNTLGYVLAAFALSVRGGMAVLLAQPNAYCRLQGCLVLAGLLGVLAWAAAPWLFMRRRGEVSAPPPAAPDAGA